MRPRHEAKPISLYTVDGSCPEDYGHPVRSTKFSDLESCQDRFLIAIQPSKHHGKNDLTDDPHGPARRDSSQLLLLI